MIKPNKALDQNSSLSYGVSTATYDHTVSPATRHKWTCPALTPASKLVLDLPIPEGWKAESTLATRQGTNQESNLRPLDHKSDALTTNYWATRCIVLHTLNFKRSYKHNIFNVTFAQTPAHIDPPLRLHTSYSGTSTFPSRLSSWLIVCVSANKSCDMLLFWLTLAFWHFVLCCQKYETNISLQNFWHFDHVGSATGRHQACIKSWSTSSWNFTF